MRIAIRNPQFRISIIDQRTGPLLANFRSVEKDYRKIIFNEFLRRRGEDANYTQRKFAKDLELGPMQLSEILRKEKGLSKMNAYSVARKLGLSISDAKEFRFLVSAQSGRSKYERTLAKQWLKFGIFKK